MKKRFAESMNIHEETKYCHAHCVAVYLASDVDALLTLLRGEIVSQSGLRNEYQDWSGALDAIAKVLPL